MTWIKLDDSFADHPKVADLSDRAFRVHISALLYCGKYLTDGVIPRSIANKFCINNASQTIQKLIENGLWKRIEGGYEINDYLKYQTSKAQAEMEKENNRLRAAKARAAKSKAIRHAVTTPEVTLTDTPTPTPTPTDKYKRLVQTSFEQFWKVYPRRDGKKKAFEAWGKALNKATIEVIMAGVEKYISGPLAAGQIPAMPATWLNGERWNDEVSASVGTTKVQRLPIPHKAVNAPGQYGVEICANCGNSWPCPKSQENEF